MWFSGTEAFFLSFFFFLTKKFIERFGEGFSLGVWPHPHERALQRSTSRVVHQTKRVWNQWYYCQCRLEVSNGTCSFYALSFWAIYRTLEKSGAGEFSIPIFKKAKAGEGGDRGWGGWMASPAQRPGVWASSGRRRRAGRPGELRPRGRKERGATEGLTSSSRKQEVRGFPSSSQQQCHRGWARRLLSHGWASSLLVHSRKPCWRKANRI